jgi:hypothetical protein
MEVYRRTKEEANVACLVYPDFLYQQPTIFRLQLEKIKTGRKARQLEYNPVSSGNRYILQHYLSQRGE